MGILADKMKKSDPWRKFFTSDSYERNLDLMHLLVSDEQFQKLIKDARKRLKIPPDGFNKEKDDQKITDWSEWLITESDRMLDSKEFNDKMAYIKKRLIAGQINAQQAREEGKTLDGTLPVNMLHNIPNNIVREFNLPIHFKEFIKHYVVSNKIDAPQHNYSGGSYQPGERPRTAGYIPISIYTQLTSDEWQELKNFVKWESRKLPKHSRIPKINRNLEIEEMYKNREREDFISGEKYLLSAEEIAEEHLGSVQEKDRVREVLRELEDLRKRRFRPNGKKL
jgi:hypothetical protein